MVAMLGCADCSECPYLLDTHGLMPEAHLCTGTATPIRLHASVLLEPGKCSLRTSARAVRSLVLGRHWLEVARMHQELEQLGARGLSMDQMCPHCGGNGARPGSGPTWERPCHKCGGKGYSGKRA
jgi:hypothetical protein